ncbi:MAG TPA: hypothetical protein G4N96_07950 [Chloroflexi bacterium]|nr:hypothetical protein [Chloroflexota bacterium]
MEQIYWKEIMPKNHNPASDLRGAGRLTIDAIKGVTDLVEAMHHTITGFGGLPEGSGQQRTTGITGMVYRNIRAASGLVGSGIDALLDKLTLIIEEKESSPEREAVLAALNGVFGDHLADKENPLAIPMQLRKNGKAMTMEDQTLSESIRQSKGKIVLMVHGSCMNDLQWSAL